MPELPELLRQDEFRALRATIRERGSLRLIVTVVTFSAWAAFLLTTCALFSVSLFCLVPLTVLAAGFEVVFALHTGVERIGRYIQVHHEPASAGQAHWERTAELFKGLSGGISALFPALFLTAGLLNLALGVLSSLDVESPVLAQNPVELLPLTALHLGFILRVLFAHRFASTQRERDRREFERLLGE
jgi:hypothetical protein